MQRKITAAMILITILMIGACATIEQLVQKPQITFESLDTRDMSLMEGTFLFRFTVSNPNPVGLHLNDILYDLDINGKRLSSSRLSQGLHLEASGKSPMEIPITVNYLDLFNSLTQFVNAGTLDYRISGSAGVGPLRIPYRSTGKLNVPKLPDIAIDSINVDSLSFTGASLKLTLGMNNPNAFAMKMDGLEYAARLGDMELAKGVARNVTPLAPGGRTTMDIDVNLNFLELGRGARSLLAGPSARCNLSGNMLVDSLAGMEKIPFQFDGKVPFLR